ncbi:cobalt ABC transporter [Roseibium aquae]|uniref:Cobalt ABC transporter n=1 Tax=Roseibium aquae TaxID=1323746 RepID=A0A916TDR8_9HYPH|nr:ABC transporter ATP-binding protein [Roseibium aquae]GGB41036.1 cobalt ABC transporter [Roseibium aquae]
MALWTKGRAAARECGLDPFRSTYAVLEGASLELNGQPVLKDITVSLKERRIGLVGLNGSGKSSFVRLLNALRLPTSGVVRIFGQPTPDCAADLPKHVGFVFQNPDHQAIFPTVEEEIAFGLTQLGRDRKSAREEARAFLARHGCAGLVERPISTLSEGQKQLICILAVLVMEPQVLILDEPFTSLDGLTALRLSQKIAGLPQKIVMVSHDLTTLAAFDRILWLEEGQVRMDGVPGDVLPAYAADLERRAATESWTGSSL